MLKYETDSRKIQKGQIFVALKGHTVDGHNYIEDAIKNGAIKVVVEKDVTCQVPVEKVASTKDYLKKQLKKDYAKEINKLKLIGITGTNGKTTSCFLLYQLLNLLGENVAYMGTLGFKYKNEDITLENTTPDILTIYKILLSAIKKGCQIFIMEISSHALSYERIYGLELDYIGFTNLTEDHLDYHKTMANYLNTKLKILDYLSLNGKLLVNIDDDASKKFLEKNNGGFTIGIKGDLSIKDFTISPDKTKIKFNYQNKDYQVTTNLISKFNVYNYLTAVGILILMNYDLLKIIELTKYLKAPKGRCETYKVNNGYAVVDFAHTPDAVQKVIMAYNELKQNRLITILGCGGDRDPLKRPLMGGIATTLSDYTILTNDNPRTEDPQKIMADILKGVKSKKYEIILDRRLAIKKGIDMMEKDDILLVLGKGHENYQIIGHQKFHLDDVEEIKKWQKEN